MDANSKVFPRLGSTSTARGKKGLRASIEGATDNVLTGTWRKTGVAIGTLTSVTGVDRVVAFSGEMVILISLFGGYGYGREDV